MAHSQSELQVITHAKNLVNYVMTITQKSPKQFRFSLVGRMQEYGLDIVQELYLANDTFVTPNGDEGKEREMHQRKALSLLKLLDYMAQVSMEQGAIQFKQYEQICQQAYNTANLTAAWIISDRKRRASVKR